MEYGHEWKRFENPVLGTDSYCVHCDVIANYAEARMPPADCPARLRAALSKAQAELAEVRALLGNVDQLAPDLAHRNLPRRGVSESMADYCVRLLRALDASQERYRAIFGAVLSHWADEDGRWLRCEACGGTGLGGATIVHCEGCPTQGEHEPGSTVGVIRLRIERELAEVRQERDAAVWDREETQCRFEEVVADRDEALTLLKTSSERAGRLEGEVSALVAAMRDVGRQIDLGANKRLSDWWYKRWCKLAYGNTAAAAFEYESRIRADERGRVLREAADAAEDSVSTLAGSLAGWARSTVADWLRARSEERGGDDG